MIRMSIQFTEEQIKLLKTIAKARKTSVANLVRESVTLFLNNNSDEAIREVKRQQVLEGLKKIKEMKYRDIEGKTDLSTNHDEYLAEIYAS
jgi:hypothetical protein